MKLAYEVVLPPEGMEKKSLPPIIFLHGRMDSKKTWRKLAPEIAKRTGREVYTLDARNHGESPWSEEMNIHVLVSDLEEFMDDLDIPKAILVGHSLGGRTALTFALKKPEAVEMLIVEDMETKPNAIAKRSVQQILILLKESLAAIPPKADETAAKKAIIQFIKSKLSPSQTPVKETEIYDLDAIPIKKKGDSYVWQANMDILEHMLMSDKGNQLSGTFTGKTLFLYGKKSFFDVGKDEDIYKYFPNAVKVGIDGAGHLVHQECPKEVLEHVTNFILK